MPQVSDEVIFMGLILGIAIFVLLILLAAVVFIRHYEHRRNDKLTLKSFLGAITDFFPKVRSKEEAALSAPVPVIAPSISQPGPNIEIESVPIEKRERLLREFKSVNWMVCFIVATYVAWMNYSYVSFFVGNTSLNIYFALLSIISPTCIAVAWLRLRGQTWQQALMLFIWVSVAFGAIWLILPYLGFIIKYFSGHCC